MSDAAGPPDGPDRGRRAAIDWGVLLTAAVVVYELTTQPALAGMTLAVKAGLADFRTAFWLRLRDPDPGRGAAHFWLFVATGLGRTCRAALLLFVAVVAVGMAVRPQLIVMPFTRGAGITLLVSCGAAVFTGVWAAARAGLGGHRLWVSRGAHSERRAGRWPPRPADPNAAPRVLLWLACGVLFVPLPTAVIAAAELVPGVVGPPGRKGGEATGLVFGLVWWATVLLLIASWNRVQDRLPARTPADAWPDPPPADPTDPYRDRWADG